MCVCVSAKLCIVMAHQQFVQMWHFFYCSQNWFFIHLIFVDSLEINAAILHFHFLHINKKGNFFLTISIEHWLRSEKEEREREKSVWKHWFGASQNMCMIGAGTKESSVVLHKNYIFRFLMFCNHIIKLSSTFAYERLYLFFSLHVFEGHSVPAHLCYTHAHSHRSILIALKCK